MMTSAVATKRDLDDFYFRVEGLFIKTIDTKVAPLIQQIVGDSVGEIVGDALQLISERFDYQDGQLKELRTDVNALQTDVSVLQTGVHHLEAAMIRVENKLDVTVATVDHHTLQIKQLQRKTA